MEQMTLEDTAAQLTNTLTHRTQIYESYLMLHQMSQWSGKTGSVCYEDENIEFSIPIVLDHMWYSRVLLDTSIPSPIKWGRKRAYMNLRKPVHSLLEYEEKYLFEGYFDYESNSKAYFKVSDIPAADPPLCMFPETYDNINMPIEEVQNRLIGVTMQAYFSELQSWVTGILSQPFNLCSIAMKRKTLYLEGSEGISIVIKGIKDIRSYSDRVIFIFQDKKKKERRLTLCSMYCDPR